LKQQLETTKIEEVKKSDYVIIIDSPEIPLIPSKPKKKLIVILAGFIGVIFGIGIGFINHYLKYLSEDDSKILKKIKLSLIQNISEIFQLKKTIAKKKI